MKNSRRKRKDYGFERDARKLLVDNDYKITKQREIIFNVLNENQEII